MSQVTIDPEVTSDDKLWAALSYPIPFVGLIVLFMADKKARPFIKYHAVQGLAFNIVFWSIYLLLTLVTVGIAAICLPAAWLVTFWPAYKAYGGEYFELPVLSGFIKNQGWV
ncbi:MAG: hypothetical protein A2W35_02215 [Chloroflexi bacterium RBG_16_57_11]|nr:MAG: hypothetical protein A2W35_02215 [Chloroflexi bacterium RBG_16_57_11]